MMTLAKEVKFEFNNPRTRSLVKLERGLLNTAKAILENANDEPIKGYLTIWQNYIYGSPAANSAST